MKSDRNVHIDIELGSEVLTPESASSLLNSTIEYLLFQRHQIPFVFQTFKYMTSKWSIEEDNTYETFHLEKQRRLALSTLNKVNDLCEHVRQECMQNNIFSARIIFGATPLTPKEIYVIKLPKVSKQHSADNHRKSAAAVTNKVLMKLLTCEKLYQAFSRNIGITNMYLYIEASDSSNGDCDNFQIKEDFNLPNRCPMIQINLVQKAPTAPDNSCCHDIAVFESIGELNITDKVETGGHSVVGKNPDGNVCWKEAKVFIRGFKDVSIKGQSIWGD